MKFSAKLAATGVAVGLAVPTARAAQAIGMLAFFPLYLLGGGGPPKGAMTGAMHSISNLLPSPIPAIVAGRLRRVAGSAGLLLSRPRGVSSRPHHSQRRQRRPCVGTPGRT